MSIQNECKKKKGREGSVRRNTLKLVWFSVLSLRDLLDEMCSLQIYDIERVWQTVVVEKQIEKE